MVAMTSNTTEASSIYNHYNETTETLDRTGNAAKPASSLDSTKITVELETTKVSTNLAILPVLAILIFLTCVCLKCCSWFRDSVKDRDEGDVENSGFIILNEGDNEYMDVEFRSDTNSCYDTVSSYTSFIKRNNQYDTVTSVRSLQPRQWDVHNTYNSYRSFLLQRLDGSKYNTVNSVRSLLRNATEMKDAEVQVELVDPVRKSTLSHTSARRHNSIDAIPLHNHSLSDSGEIKQHRDLKRGQRHRVSFVDSKGTKTFVNSRSLSVDASNSPLTEDNVRKNSPSLKHLWGIRDQPRLNPANKYSPPKSLSKRPSPPQDRQPELVDAATSPTMDHITPSRKHRFKVTKADESQLPSRVNDQNQKHRTSKLDDQNNKLFANEHHATSEHASCEHPSLLRNCHRHSPKINVHKNHMKQETCESPVSRSIGDQLVHGCATPHISRGSDAQNDPGSEHNRSGQAPTIHSNDQIDHVHLSCETPSNTHVISMECHNENHESKGNSPIINDVSKNPIQYPEICSPRHIQIDDEEQDVGFCSDDTDSGVCNELTAFLNEEDTRL